MQQASFQGMKDVIKGVNKIAQHISDAAVKLDGSLLSNNLFVCHCLYQASSECAWFIKEDNHFDDVACLNTMVGLLRAIGTKWGIAGKFLCVYLVK